MLTKTLLIIIQVIFLETILSIDNALVLAAIAERLPKRSVPIPRFLSFLRPISKKLLRNQQHAVLEAGLLGAYLGRGLLLFLATYIIQHTWIKVFGALYLLHLASEHLGNLAKTHTDFSTEIKQTVQDERKILGKRMQSPNQTNFWHMVLTIELADLIFSIDNVVAIVALSSQFVIIIIGVAIGILLMRLAAEQLIQIIQKLPALGVSAYVLIFNISIELLISALFGVHLSEITKFSISLATVIFALLYGQIPQYISEKLNKILLGFGVILYGLDYVLTLKWLNLHNQK